MDLSSYQATLKLQYSLSRYAILLSYSFFTSIGTLLVYCHPRKAFFYLALLEHERKFGENIYDVKMDDAAIVFNSFGLPIEMEIGFKLELSTLLGQYVSPRGHDLPRQISVDSSFFWRTSSSSMPLPSMSSSSFMPPSSMPSSFSMPPPSHIPPSQLGVGTVFGFASFSSLYDCSLFVGLCSSTPLTFSRFADCSWSLPTMFSTNPTQLSSTNQCTSILSPSRPIRAITIDVMEGRTQYNPPLEPLPEANNDDESDDGSDDKSDD